MSALASARHRGSRVMKKGRTKRMMGALAFAGGLIVACSSGDQSETTARSEQEAVLGPCAKHADCEDGNPCTQNLCAVGVCLVPLPVLGCCFNGQCNTAGAGGTGGTLGIGGIGGALPIGGLGGALPIGGLGGALPIGGLGGALPIGGLGGALPIGGTAGTGGALPIGCSIDAQCEDGNPCTQNLCLIGLCLPLPVLGCCYQGVCEDDGSAGAGGEPPIVTGGCSTNEQCADNNECTQNLCVLGLCTTLPVLNCDGSAGAPPVLGCSTNDECEDGNDCIQNLCLLGLCTSLPVIGGVCGGEGGTSGSGGTAGTAGNGGTAGSSGAAGNVGTAGNGGTAGSSGSANGGSAGSSAGSDVGGNAGENTGGTANGGSAVNGGEGGTDTGGTSGTSGANNTGATSAAAGEAGQSNNDRDPNIDWGMQGGGCGCKVAAAPQSSSLLSALMAGLGFVAIRARRQKRASGGTGAR
jgi:hypothetical protein